MCLIAWLQWNEKHKKNLKWDKIRNWNNFMLSFCLETRTLFGWNFVRYFITGLGIFDIRQVKLIHQRAERIQSAQTHLVNTIQFCFGSIQFRKSYMNCFFIPKFNAAVILVLVVRILCLPESMLTFYSAKIFVDRKRWISNKFNFQSNKFI